MTSACISAIVIEIGRGTMEVLSRSSRMTSVSIVIFSGIDIKHPFGMCDIESTPALQKCQSSRWHSLSMRRSPVVVSAEAAGLDLCCYYGMLFLINCVQRTGTESTELELNQVSPHRRFLAHKDNCLNGIHHKRPEVVQRYSTS